MDADRGEQSSFAARSMDGRKPGSARACTVAASGLSTHAMGRVAVMVFAIANRFGCVERAQQRRSATASTLRVKREPNRARTQRSPSWASRCRRGRATAAQLRRRAAVEPVW